MEENKKIELTFYIIALLLASISVVMLLNNKYIVCSVYEQDLDAGHNKDLLFNVSNDSVDITTKIKENRFIIKTCFKTKEYLDDYIESFNSESSFTSSESIFNFSSIKFNLSSTSALNSS